MKKEKMKAKVEEDNGEEETKKSVILLSSSDDEEANGDLTLEIVEKARVRESKRKRNQDSVISLSSSSDEVELVAEVVQDQSNDGGGGGGTVEVAVPELKKRKRNKKKKKKDKNIVKEGKEQEMILNFVEEEKVEPLKSVETETVGVVGTGEVVERAKTIETEAVGAIRTEEMEEKTKSKDTEGAEIPDNVVLRKLLRGPRYFDPPDSSWSTCYNCGEEGHMAVNCTVEKRKKPCFVCGSFEHGARQCKQGQDCYICKKTGHRAKKCPEKNKGTSQISEICLRCGDSGHNMFSCMNDYCPEDLKEIQCYVCKRFGHLCCIDFMDTGAREVSCYNCGQSGHTGSGCAKQRGETSGAVSATLCFKCGEEGHFARGCTNYAKPDWRMGEFSTPVQHFTRGVGDSYGVRSLPHDISKARKKKHIQYEERGTVTPRKSKHRGGWNADDPGDLPNRKAQPNIWRSPATPAHYEERGMTPLKSKHRGGWSADDPGDFPHRKSKPNIWRSPAIPTHYEERENSTPGKSKHRGGWITDDPGDMPNRKTKPNIWRSPTTTQKHAHASSSRSPKKAKLVPGTPSSHGSAQPYHQHRYSASRFGNYSNGGQSRSYDW